jgi:polyferredoxin
MRRLLIQSVAALGQNPFLANFWRGNIYSGNLKSICTPGLNCYSCPAAAFACPVGSAQSFFAGAGRSIGLFVTGFLLATAVVFGRFICGYVCPFGLVQDLLYRIKSPKLRRKFRVLRYVKYLLLLLFVIALPLLIRNEFSGTGEPWYCKYVCPSGTIFGAIPLMAVHEGLRDSVGTLFRLKAAIAAAVIFTSVVVFRPFCRILCPLGAFYGLFNRFAVFGLHCDKSKCNSCGKCERVCDSGVDPVKSPNSPECIRCGDCVKACRAGALSRKVPKNKEQTVKS